MTIALAGSAGAEEAETPQVLADYNKTNHLADMDRRLGELRALVVVGGLFLRMARDRIEKLSGRLNGSSRSLRAW